MAMALVMFSTEAVGSALPAVQKLDASLSLTKAQRANPVLTGGQDPAASRVAPEAVVSFSTNLVAHWRFDEGSGTNAVDASGRGHHGTLQDFPRNTSQ